MRVVRGFGAAVLAIGVMTSIASMVVRLPREMHSLQALRWSKLAAERLASGTRMNDTRMLFEALGAADHALRIEPRFAEARFQRAAVLEKLGLSAHAAKAYADCLRVDTSSVHAEFALKRTRKLRMTFAQDDYVESWDFKLQQLRAEAMNGHHSAVAALVRRFPAQSRAMAESGALGIWAEAFRTYPATAAKELTVAREIARALAENFDEHLSTDAIAVVDAALATTDSKRLALLARGYELYSTRYNGEWFGPASQARMDEAVSAFHEARSPMQWAAEYERAKRSTLSIEGCKAIEQLTRTAPTNYRWLQAHIYRRHSDCLAMSGEFMEALVAGRHAIGLFGELGEYDNAVLSRIRQEEVIRQVDDRNALWQFRKETLASAGTVNSAWLNSELSMIAHDAVSEASWDVVRSVATLIIDWRRCWR